MKPHLSGWQRLGIVISIIWIVGSFVGFRWQMVHERVHRFEAACAEAMTPECNPLFDVYALDRAYRWRKGDLATLSLISFGGLAIFWLAGWASIKTIRWVRAGFS